MLIPSAAVLQAFRAVEPPVMLPGGQGETFRSGDIVLKLAQDDDETRWIAEFYLQVQNDGFRVPKPIRLAQGGFVYQGWQAWEYLPGEHQSARWLEIIDVCLKFHAAISAMPYPNYFARRDNNPWVIADQIAWDELTIEHHPKTDPIIRRLRRCLRPIDARSQLIHGDFGGNVLFETGLFPAVIDFSPYWRPVPFAIGVIIADAIVWGGAEYSLIDAGSGFENFIQYLLRAELRRVIELDTLHRDYGWDTLGEIDAHLPLVNVICDHVSA